MLHDFLISNRGEILDRSRAKLATREVPTPTESVMAVSVPACAHYYAAAYQHGRGPSPGGLSVEVEVDKERLPLARLGRFSIKVRLPSGLGERQIAGIERAVKSCPAYGTLLHPPEVEIVFEGDPTPQHEGSPA